jgi:hypothetical protein
MMVFFDRSQSICTINYFIATKKIRVPWDVCTLLTICGCDAAGGVDAG